jgi:L-rhamnose mutarotase
MDKDSIVQTISGQLKLNRVAFKMQLFKGCEAEYKRRHDAIWPELILELKLAGIREYSIFFDAPTSMLFGVMYVTDLARLDDLRAHPLMRKWWAYMKDIMETNEDDSPVSFSLQEVFFLP